MRIGELSERTGASPRSLRYYEQQGLLRSERRSNGYREYDAGSVEVVSTIRTFLDAGLSTEVIRDILPCASGRAPSSTACPDLLARVMAIRDGLEEHADRITTQREKLEEYLDSAGTPGR